MLKEYPHFKNDALLELFKKLINNIIGDVRTRLIQDAKKEGLMESRLLEPNQMGSAQKQYIIEIKKKYPQARTKYDEIISAIGEYFDLFKANTDRLEDLWV
jgi:hypothetical protein